MSAALYLIARIAERTVAFPAEHVDSAVDLGPITPVPLAAAGVVGLAALRSRVVTVIEPRVALGLPPAATPSPRAIVTRVEGHFYAIVVDALEDVAEFSALPVPSGAALGNWAPAAIGMIDRGGEPLLAIAPDRLIPHASAPHEAAA